MIAFVYSKMNGAAIWEDYYAKEVVSVVDLAKPGDVIILDVQKATLLAQKNKIKNFEDIFQFDNIKNEVCVKLSVGRASCFNFFNDVNVGIESNNKWIQYDYPVNRLHIKIIAKGAA
jgi:hypothetical protein